MRAPATTSPPPTPIISPVRIRPNAVPRCRWENRSPVNDATAGYATAVTPPRKRRAPSNIPNEVANPPNAIASPHMSTIPRRREIRGSRSTATPAGIVATAATRVTAAARRPSSACPIPKACSSEGASAPTAPRSAASTASTPARMTTVRRTGTELPARSTDRATRGFTGELPIGFPLLGATHRAVIRRTPRPVDQKTAFRSSRRSPTC